MTNIKKITNATIVKNPYLTAHNVLILLKFYANRVLYIHMLVLTRKAV